MAGQHSSTALLSGWRMWPFGLPLVLAGIALPVHIRQPVLCLQRGRGRMPPADGEAVPAVRALHTGAAELHRAVLCAARGPHRAGHPDVGAPWPVPALRCGPSAQLPLTEGPELSPLPLQPLRPRHMCSDSNSSWWDPSQSEALSFPSTATGGCTSRSCESVVGEQPGAMNDSACRTTDEPAPADTCER